MTDEKHSAASHAAQEASVQAIVWRIFSDIAARFGVVMPNEDQFAWEGLIHEAIDRHAAARSLSAAQPAAPFPAGSSLTADVRRETAEKDAQISSGYRLLEENRRLREELERFRRDQPQLALDAAAFRQDRDALAEALREVLTSLAAFSLNANLSISLNAAKDSGWAALARAEKTPTEDRGEGQHGA